MTTDPCDPDPVYCPRCFRVVQDQRVFCYFCGQFVHAHTPADSRSWDSRLSDLTVLEPAPPAERPTIELPEETSTYQQNQSVPNNEEPKDQPDPASTADSLSSDELGIRDKIGFKDPEPAVADNSTEPSVAEPIISGKSDIEQGEEPQQDHRATT